MLSYAKCCESNSTVRSRSRSSGTTGLSRPDCAMVDRLSVASDEQGVVQHGRGQRAEEWANPVDVLTLEDAAGDRGTERACRIQGSAGERTDREDARGESESDGESS